MRAKAKTVFRDDIMSPHGDKEETETQVVMGLATGQRQDRNTIFSSFYFLSHKAPNDARSSTMMHHKMKACTIINLNYRKSKLKFTVKK